MSCCLRSRLDLASLPLPEQKHRKKMCSSMGDATRATSMPCCVFESPLRVVEVVEAGGTTAAAGGERGGGGIN